MQVELDHPGQIARRSYAQEIAGSRSISPDLIRARSEAEMTLSVCAERIFVIGVGVEAGSCRQMQKVFAALIDEQFKARPRNGCGAASPAGEYEAERIVYDYRLAAFYGSNVVGSESCDINKPSSRRDPIG